jgi:phage tail protein X
MTMPTTVDIRREGLTIDLLLYRAYGLDGQVLVEQALEMNPGVASLGAVLPLGTSVILPDKPQRVFAARAVVSLFGD